MIRVNVICEDRTGGGLPRLITAATNAKRHADGRPALWFPPEPGTVNGSSALLASCGKFSLYRKSYRPPSDHVVYVIDAKNLWNIPTLHLRPPRPREDMTKYLTGLRKAAEEEMTRRARGDSDAKSWQQVARYFHPHVLVWERESLFLPVADRLGLGAVPRERPPTAAAWIDDRFRQHVHRPYGKATDGRALFDRIIGDAQMRDAVLADNESLRTIVDDLAGL